MELSIKTIMLINGIAGEKDKYTREHSIRVAEYSKIIAEEMRWDKDKIDKLYKTALLHDIGKVGVSAEILNKPGRLTEEEYNKMKEHTVIGSMILKKIPLLSYAAPGAEFHHERYDGKGYPSGLSGNEIPIEARIIAVADAFDAMNSDRIYRKKLEKEQIMNELKSGRGTHFDPDIIDAFLEKAEKILYEDSTDKRK
ncbi:MAG: HD-GYP domain-containing protein [Anaerovoracaceae bacterium]